MPAPVVPIAGAVEMAAENRNTGFFKKIRFPGNAQIRRIDY